MKTAWLLTVAILLGLSSAAQYSEYGFLPGKKFPFYKSIGTHDLQSKRIRIQVKDERKALGLESISCSEIPLRNQTEFKGEYGEEVIRKYLTRLLADAHAISDSLADEILEIEIQALDARLVGFGSITAHGLCQLKISYQGESLVMCTDLTDKDPHSPISSKAWVTRKTATRVILSAAIRETVEKIISMMERDRN